MPADPPNLAPEPSRPPQTAPQTAPACPTGGAGDDLSVLAEQAELLRRQGRSEAADQLLAWRDLHAIRLAQRGQA